MSAVDRRTRAPDRAGRRRDDGPGAQRGAGQPPAPLPGARAAAAARRRGRRQRDAGRPASPRRFGYERVAARLARCRRRPTTSTSSSPACRRPATGRSSWLPRPPASTSSARSRSADRPRRPPRCSEPAGRPACSTASPPAIAGRRRCARSGSSSGAASSARSGACAPRSCSTTRPTRTSRSCGGSGRRWRAVGSRSTPATTWSTAPGSSSARSRPSRRSRRRSSPSGRCPAPTRSATAAAGRARARAGRDRARRRRGCGRRPAHLRERRLRGARDEPRRDRQARLAPARGLRLASGRPTGTSSDPTSSGCACPATSRTFGFRRVLVNPGHPGAAELLIAGTDGTSIGWLGQECAMWAEFLGAIAEGRPGSADFTRRRPRQRRHRCAVCRRR